MLDSSIWISTLRVYAPEFNSVDLSGVVTRKAITPTVDPTVMQFTFDKGSLQEFCGYPYRELGKIGVLTVPAKQINERLIAWAQAHPISDAAVINRVLSVAAEPTVLNVDGESLEYDNRDHTWWLIVDRHATVLETFGCEVLDYNDETKVLILKENSFSYSIHSPKEDRRGRPRKEIPHDDVWSDVYAMDAAIARYIYQLPVMKLYTDPKTSSVYVITNSKGYEKVPDNIPHGWALANRSDNIFKFQHR